MFQSRHPQPRTSSTPLTLSELQRELISTLRDPLIQRLDNLEERLQRSMQLPMRACPSDASPRDKSFVRDRTDMVKQLKDTTVTGINILFRKQSTDGGWVGAQTENSLEEKKRFGGYSFLRALPFFKRNSASSSEDLDLDTEEREMADSGSYRPLQGSHEYDAQEVVDVDAREEIEVEPNEDGVVPSPVTPQISRNSSKMYSLSRLKYDSIKNNAHGSLASGGYAACKEVAGNVWFNHLSGCAIVANAVSLGIQVDYRARNWTQEVPLFFTIFDVILCVFFLAECAIRIAGLGYYKYIMKDFAVDFVCVCSFTLETSIRWIPSVSRFLALEHNLAVFTLLRALRLVRIVRLFKLLKVSIELRNLWFCVLQSVRSLFWTCFLVCGVVYISGVYVTQVVTNHKLAHPEASGDEEEELQRFFGTLDRTLLSLYEAMSEGTHWAELAEPLRKHVSPWAAWLFAMYMAFVVFAVLNVITAHLCDYAVKLGKNNETEKLKEKLTKVFYRVLDEDGMITWQVLTEHLESREMTEYLSAVDLTKEDAKLLFKVLDRGEHKINMYEFVEGCTRVNGPAKATDIVEMTKRFSSLVQDVEQNLRNSLKEISVTIDQRKEPMDDKSLPPSAPLA